MHACRALLLLLTIFLPSSVLASAECAAIDNDVARLQCYDSLYAKPEASSEVPSVGDALLTFRELVEYTADDELRQVYLQDCVMFDHSVRKRTVVGTQQIVFWQLLLDLKEVDAEDTGLTSKGSTSIIMNRGSEISYSGQYVRQADVSKPLLFSAPLDINPLLWLELASNEQAVLGLYNHTFNQPVKALSFKHSKERSLEWNLAYFHPEDAPEISQAFVALVRACQQ